MVFSVLPCVFVPLHPKRMFLALRSPSVSACLCDSDSDSSCVLKGCALCLELRGGAWKEEM